MSDGMLLGIDEGTTGVKAALFDQRLQPVAEARRDKVNRHPEEGWVEQDGEEVIAAVTESVAELLKGADGDVVACGLDHQGESVLAWDSETGKPLSPIVVWQDKRSQEILDGRLTDKEDEVKEAQRPAVRPLLLGRQAGLAAEEQRRGEEGTDRRQASDGYRRFVPLRPPRRRLRDRAGNGVSDPAPADRPAGLGRAPLRDLRHPDGRAARDPRFGWRPGNAPARELAG